MTLNGSDVCQAPGMKTIVGLLMVAISCVRLPMGGYSTNGVALNIRPIYVYPIGLCALSEHVLFSR